jgi:hypothetical protein
MKKEFLRLDLWILCLLMCSLVACDRKDTDNPISEEEDTGVPYERPYIISEEVINQPAAYVGDIPSDMRSALDKRFINVSGLTPETKVAVIHANALDAVDDEMIRQVYDNGGTIVVIDPVHSTLQPWCEENGFNYAGARDDLDGDVFGEMYAFNRNDAHYSMDPIPEEEDHNEFLNSFTSWVNEQLAPPPPPANANPQDVKALFSSQQITHNFPLSLEKQEAHMASSQPDIIKGVGSIDVKMIIYALYAFEDQGEHHGDYYIVSTTATVHNKGMYIGKWGAKHGAIYTHLCGFYMREMNMVTLITDRNTSPPAGVTFAPGGTPVPPTTPDKTEYTSGVSWSFGGSITGNVGADKQGKNISLSPTINGGVTFSNSTKRTVSDVSITNNWTSAMTNYTYPFQNLPSGSADIKTDKNGTEAHPYSPPSIVRSNAEFYQDWIWHVPTPKDGSTENYWTIVGVSGIYGSSHYYTSQADYKQNSWRLPPVVTAYFQSFLLKPPSRIPTGTLSLCNVSTEFDNLTATNIKVTKSGTEYSILNSIAPTQTLDYILPIGTYRVDLQMGPDRGHLTDYFHKEVTIKRGEKTSFNIPFDFCKKGDPCDK